LKNTQIAVLGFAGVQKNGRRAGRTKSGGNILTDLAGFSHTANNEFPFFLMYVFHD
jgi:hypothetical protein